MKNKKSMSEINNKFQIVTNDYSIWKSPHTIKSYSGEIVSCPNCNSKINVDYTLIPISKTQRAKVFGLFCRECRCLYVNNKDDINKLLCDNIYAKEFTLDGEELWNYSTIKQQRKKEERRIKKEQELRELHKQKRAERYEKLNAVVSAEVMICIQYTNKKQEEIIIVNDPLCADEQKNIFHYSSDAGREFLSAAFAQKRNRRGRFNEMNYRTTERPLYNNKAQYSLSQHILPIDLTIKKDGGYSSSILNNNYEIVDMLVYSPFTNRYEIMKATHDKRQEMCFVDICRYRNFIHEYGNPELFPFFESRRNLVSGFDNLNEESILKGYGYDVNKGDNLSSKYRQELLAEIIDLDIMKASKIVRFLNDFLIPRHPQHPEAQNKWREDIHFVENYKANPQRFLIAKDN